MKVIACLSALWLVVAATPEETERTSVGPEYLDLLLKEERYDEFSDIMELGDPKLAHSDEDAPPRTRHEAMFNKDLEWGDIVLTERQREEARQGLDFNKHGRYKWPNREAIYWISDKYNSNEWNTIKQAIDKWNNEISCIKFRPWRNGDNDWIHIYSGNGCFARLGRTGGEQPLSLDKNGCVSIGIALHEMQHAIGFNHEHNRCDRDDYIEMLWHNIPDGWKSQYEKTNKDDYGLQGSYDYYSNMHYPVNVPGTNDPAFRVRQSGIDERRIGNRYGFTDMDRRKICELYA